MAWGPGFLARSHYGSVAPAFLCSVFSLSLSKTPVPCETSDERGLLSFVLSVFQVLGQFGMFLQILITSCTCWRRQRSPACRTQRPPALRTWSCCTSRRRERSWKRSVEWNVAGNIQMFCTRLRKRRMCAGGILWSFRFETSGEWQEGSGKEQWREGKVLSKMQLFQLSVKC